MKERVCVCVCGKCVLARTGDQLALKALKHIPLCVFVFVRLSVCTFVFSRCQQVH